MRLCNKRYSICDKKHPFEKSLIWSIRNNETKNSRFILYPIINEYIEVKKLLYILDKIRNKSVGSKEKSIFNDILHLKFHCLLYIYFQQKLLMIVKGVTFC